MKPIFLINRIDRLGALLHRAGTPFSLLFALRAPSGGAQAGPSGSAQEIPAGHGGLSRQAELEQYPIDPKNPLHPVETSVSVARRCERQGEYSAPSATVPAPPTVGVASRTG
jgi:hypothetical protein